MYFKDQMKWSVQSGSLPILQDSNQHNESTRAAKPADLRTWRSNGYSYATKVHNALINVQMEKSFKVKKRIEKI